MRQTIILILIAVVAFMGYCLHVQLEKVNSLELELKEHQIEIPYIDDIAIWEDGYDAGFEEGYSQGTWEMIDYYDDYIGTDEFFNDYGITPAS